MMVQMIQDVHSNIFLEKLCQSCVVDPSVVSNNILFYPHWKIAVSAPACKLTHFLPLWLIFVVDFSLLVMRPSTLMSTTNLMMGFEL